MVGKGCEGGFGIWMRWTVEIRDWTCTGALSRGKRAGFALHLLSGALGNDVGSMRDSLMFKKTNTFLRLDLQSALLKAKIHALQI